MAKKALIILGIVVLALIVLGFVGMNMLTRPAGVTYQQNLNGTQTYSNNEGSVTLGTGASMPADWPSDVPGNYSGATIVYSGNANPQTGAAGAVVSYTVPGASTQTVADYYKSGLMSQGWTIEGTADFSGQKIVTAKKDNRTFGVTIADAGDGITSVTAALQLQ